MITYNDFLKENIDLSPLGLLPPSEHFVPYFCTPENYTLIGSLGVDGIHFVFVRGHGETVFVITPMGEMPYCFPVARNFDHFLRLLLAVGDCNVMEYLHAFAIENLEKYKRENPLTEEALETLQKITALGLEPLPDPCTYVSDLDGGFDLSRLRFSDEYYETTEIEPPEKPSWGVFFENDKKYPCDEVRCNVPFTWRGREWLIPAYHTSKKGLAVDICTSIDADAVKDYLSKAENITDEEADALSEISPTNLHFSPSVTVDGRPMTHTSGHYFYYSPNFESKFFNSDAQGELAVEHYGLDTDKYWIVVRAFFQKATRSAPKYDSITLTMNDDPLRIPGSRFTIEDAGDTVSLTSPVDGTEYVLKAVDYTSEELPPAIGYLKFPSHVKVLYYTLTPEPERRTFFIRDIVNGDPPIEGHSDENDDFAAAIAMIGGADGPTAVMFSKPTASTAYKTVTSNPHYDPDFTPVWLPSWQMKKEGSLNVTLNKKGSLV